MKLNSKIRNDIILVALLLIVAIVALIILSVAKTEGGYAVVVQNGKEIASYPLNKNTEVVLKYEGNYNVLVISDGYAKVTDASCPDKLCVHQSRIKYNGETLVCLPNKTTVKIVSDNNSNVDLIS